MATWKNFTAIACGTKSGGIGLHNKIPWNIKADLLRFKSRTLALPPLANPHATNAVIMGRRTFESIPKRPLPGRVNLVVTSKKRGMTEYDPWTVYCPSFSFAVNEAMNEPLVGSVFAIGGASIYREALCHPQCTTVEYTRILNDDPIPQTDVAFPEEDMQHRFELAKTSPVQTEGVWRFQYETWNRKQRHQEYQYLDLLREALEHGTDKADRTGTGTRSLFGKSMTFSLRNGEFPLITTKRVFWRAAFEELFWFLSGSTDSTVLSKKGINIWQGNTSREYLDAHGFRSRAVGDIGPGYGWQWRSFGAKFNDARGANAGGDGGVGGGVDQIKEIVRQILHTPDSRRIILSAWNPAQIHEMSLPPCHVLSQFSVQNGELSCALYQRSGDLFLGVPFNIASYSLLTVLLAHHCRLKSGSFTHFLGDSHIYKNHFDAVRTQLSRKPKPFPKIYVKMSPWSIPGPCDLSDYCMDDIVMSNYDSHLPISAPMAV